LKIEGGYIRPEDEARAVALEGEASTRALPRSDQELAESAGAASAVQTPAMPIPARRRVQERMRRRRTTSFVLSRIGW